MTTSALSALLLSLTTILTGLTAQVNNLQVSPTSQVAQVVSSQKATLTASDFVYKGYYDVQTYGNDTSYMRSLTHRYVNGELRFLTLTHKGDLHEFKISGTSYGGKVTTTTGIWDISSLAWDHTGIWWDEPNQRLWVTGSVDYGSASTFYATKISTVTLGANGALSNAKTVSLQGINSKLVYGGVVPIPTWFQQQAGCGPYGVGFGGYTSLVASASSASMGPTFICMPDPANYSNGAQIPTGSFKVLLNNTGNRGARKTIPENYFDGGDTRPNGTGPGTNSTRPTNPPLSTAGYLSPRSDGLGWFVWGDSYYNTGMWIEGATKQGFVSIASLAKGKAWYCGSTLCFDDRQYELHIWNPNSLTNGLLTQPTSMTELVLPRGYTPCAWGGNTPGCNIGGATYDSVSGKMYLIGFPLGPDSFTGRLFEYQVNAGGTISTPTPTTPTTPTPTPTDATVSSWSAWSDTSSWTTCSSSGTQTKTQVRTRTVTVAATNGGTTPSLSETQTVSQSCTVTTTPTVPSEATGLLSGYTYCLDEGGTCTFSGTKKIAYGAQDKYYYKDFTDRAYCHNSSFGDPIVGVVKKCYIKDDVVVSVPTNATVSAWSAWSDTSSWTTCSSSGTQTKTQVRTRTVTVAATNGGTTPVLSETQTVSQSCTVPTVPVPTQTPTPDPVPTTPTTPTSTTQITQNLRYGSRGSQVTTLQNFLISKGYLKSGLNSGFFGFSTYSAVKSFQRANGISATGYVGTQTRAVINSQI